MKRGLPLVLATFLFAPAGPAGQKPAPGRVVPEGLPGEWKGPAVVVVGNLVEMIAHKKEADGYLVLHVVKPDILELKYKVDVKGGSFAYGTVLQRITVKEKEGKRFLVLKRFDKDGGLELGFDLSGNTLKLASPRKVSVFGVKGPVDLSGDWTRIGAAKPPGKAPARAGQKAEPVKPAFVLDVGPRALAVAFGPKGKLLASTLVTGQVKLWDAETGKLKSEFNKYNAADAWSVAFSPDGGRVAAGFREESRARVRVWNTRTGKVVQDLPFEDWRLGLIQGLAFHPGGDLLARGIVQQNFPGGAEAQVKVWDLRERQDVYTVPGGWKVTFGPGGKKLFVGTWKGDIEVRDAASGAPLATWKGHAAPVGSLSLSRDGKRLASSTWEGAGPGEVKVWDVAAGKAVFEQKGHHGNTSVALSPDGKWLASAGSDGLVRVRPAAGGKEALRFRAQRSVFALAFSPDGRRLATAGDDRDGPVKVWDVGRLK